MDLMISILENLTRWKILNKRSICSLISVLGVLLLITTLSFPNVKATEIWGDNFSDPDLLDWTIEEGEFFISDGILTPSTLAQSWDPILENYSIIRHNSSTTIGTWSFDLIGKEKEDYWVQYSLCSKRFVEIQFMANTLDYWNQTGYAFGIWYSVGYHSSTVSFCLHKWIEGNPEGRGVKQFVPSSFNGRHHIDITRNSTGHISVFINDTLRLKYQNTEIDTSNYFAIGSFGNL